MGQFWDLYNLDKKTFIKFPSSSMKLVEWFFGDDPTCILTKLRHDSKNSWAGDRIICFGDYARSIPEGIMSKDEVSALMKEGIPIVLKIDDVNSDDIHIRDILTYMGQRKREKFPQKPKEDVDYSNCVLRNLSKKMFVRGDNPPLSVPECVNNSFGQTLFAYICWSDDPSTSMIVEDHEIIKGPWAGDRFDIVDFNSVKDELNQEGWEDCTEELKQRVEGMYMAEGLI